jgi:hypothetical protein
MPIKIFGRILYKKIQNGSYFLPRSGAKGSQKVIEVTYYKIHLKTTISNANS